MRVCPCDLRHVIHAPTYSMYIEGALFAGAHSRPDMGFNGYVGVTGAKLDMTTKNPSGCFISSLVRLKGRRILKKHTE